MGWCQRNATQIICHCLLPVVFSKLVSKSVHVFGISLSCNLARLMCIFLGYCNWDFSLTGEGRVVLHYLMAGPDKPANISVSQHISLHIYHQLPWLALFFLAESHHTNTFFKGSCKWVYYQSMFFYNQSAEIISNDITFLILLLWSIPFKQHSTHRWKLPEIKWKKIKDQALKLLFQLAAQPNEAAI